MKKYALIPLFLFLSPAEAAQEEGRATVTIKEGDILTYPPEAEPVRVEALFRLRGEHYLLKQLFYSCVIMPGDRFEISSIWEDSNQAVIIKTAGAPGNQETCHKESSVRIEVSKQIIKTDKRFPKTVFKVPYPFVFHPAVLENGQIRYLREREGHPSAVETSLFRENDVIVYPPSAKPIEIKAFYNALYFYCSVAPGDSFKIEAITNYTTGDTHLMLLKTEGAAGNQETCPEDVFISMDAENCKLTRTETGIPDAVRCQGSLEDLFLKFANSQLP